jgi:hypothetical protein
VLSRLLPEWREFVPLLQGEERAFRLRNKESKDHICFRKIERGFISF